MPWNERRVMNEKIRFINEVNASEESLAEVCRQFGISRKTAYKWMKRYQEQGPSGLEERSHAVRSQAHATPLELVHRLVELRKEHPSWGPKKLKARLETLGVEGVPAESTIGQLLKKHGLIRPRRRRVYPLRMPSELHLAMQPNDTWCIDFKGQFRLGDGTMCYPLTVTDAFSRYLLKCEALTSTESAPVQRHVERAFGEYGLPWRIRSDNGAPFASVGAGGLSALSLSWLKVGIELDRIEPGCPQQNGRHERMHRVLQEETAQPAQGTLLEQQQAFDVFRRIYNDERPHEALGQKTPSQVYSVSPRNKPSQPQSPSYGDAMQVRHLDRQGRLSFQGERMELCRLLAQEPVGLEEIGPEHWEVFYGSVLLAELRMKEQRVHMEKVR